MTLRILQANCDAWNAANMALLDSCYTDICDDSVTVTSDYTGVLSDSCGLTGSLMVIYTIADDCGNETKVTATYTVIDTTAPDLTNCMPLDVTVECDAETLEEACAEWDSLNVVYLADCATDACDDSVTVTSDYNPENTEIECGSAGTLYVTYTVKDDCGNASYFYATYTVTDTTAPEIVCPDDLVLTCEDSLTHEASIQAWLATVSGSDNCNFDTITNNYDPGAFTDSCLNTGIQIVTFTAWDECGNSATCMAQISIVDTVGPTAMHTKPVLPDCIDPDDIPTFQELVDDGYITAVDNCDPNPFIYLVDSTEFEFPPDHPTNPCYTSRNFIYQAIDSCGNTGNLGEISLVFRVDTVPPVIVCNDYPHLGCERDSVPGPFELIFGGYVQFDNPDGACEFNLLILPIKDSLFQDGCDSVQRWLFKGIDGCFNNSNFCTVDIRWAADAPIELDCPDPLTLDCADPANDSLITAWLDDFSATDACSPIDTMYNDYDGNFSDECGETGSITVTFWATDTCGNIASCQSTITIQDTTPPSIECPDTLTLECGVSLDPGVNTELADWLNDVTGDDECSGAIVGADSTTYNAEGFSDMCGETGMQTVTFYISDSCGNVASCDAVVRIVDTTDPVIECPDDLTIECTADRFENEDIFDWLDSATATDTCGDVTITHNYNPEGFDTSGCGLTGLQVVTFVATDRCGNTDTCTATIYLEDTTDPELSCGTDLTLECSEDRTLSNPVITAWIETFTAVDGCDTLVDVTNNYDPFGYDNSLCGLTGIQVVTFVAMDDCGNTDTCMATVTLIDTLPPVLTCPDDVTTECDSSLTGYLATAVDACSDSVTVTYTDTEIENPDTTANCLPIIERKFVATDDCGNMSMCIMYITLEDNTPPTFSYTPPDTTVQCGMPYDTAALGVALGVDNCDTMPTVKWLGDITVQPDICDTMVINRLWRVTDACGNGSTADSSLHIQEILIIDTVPPDFECPEDVTIICGDDLPSYELEAFDVCSGAADVYVASIDSNGVCPIVVTITYEAEDECGNIGSCTQKVTIVDTVGPEVTCPDDLVIQCGESLDPDENTSLGDWLESATAVDDCSGWSLDSTSYTETGFSDGCGATGEQVVVFYASDSCGNVGVCEATITIVDTVPPMVMCPDTVTAECNIDPIPMTAPIASDECGGTTYTFVDTSYETPCDTMIGSYGFVVEVIERTFTVSDSCGNTATCQQIILITDETPPEIECPPFVTVECGDDLSPDSLGWATATDVCSDTVDIIITQEFVVDPNPCATVMLRVFVASDGCGTGASNECFQEITIVDTKAPVITPLADTTIECGEDLPTNLPDAVDICDTAVVVTETVGDTMGSGCERWVVRYFTASDQCGNMAVDSQTVFIIDTTPPVMVCPPAEVSVECGQPLPDDAPTATDACDGDVMVSVVTSDTMGVGCNRMIVRTYTAMDECGNTASCSVKYTLIDTTPPMITCPGDLLLDCGTYSEEDIGDWLDMITATDECSGVTITADYDADSVMQACSGDAGLEVTFTATDSCGNTATCVASIFVVDTTGPTIDGECPEDITLAWDEGITCLDFNDRPDGPISSIFIDGVTITITAWEKLLGETQAWIFDTENPSMSDTDLGTPNKLFGGPGINGDNASGWNLTNNNAQGKAIVVQDLDSGEPDDSFLSDSLIFEFDCPVFLESIVNLDFEIEMAETGAGAFMYDSSGNLLNFVAFSGGEDNNHEEVLLQTFDVSVLKVYFGSTPITSGAVARICFASLCDKPEVVWTDDCSQEISDTCTQELVSLDECQAFFKRTWSATDECGNESEVCEQNITVDVDGIRPIIDCPPTIFIGCDSMIPPVDIGTVTATDNCTPMDEIGIFHVGDFVLDSDELDSLGLTNCEEDSYKRIYKAVDGCGNEALCVQFIIRFDSEVEVSAELLLLADLNVFDSTGTMQAKINGILPLAQPYSAAPYNYPGGESVLSMDADVVDWVLIELRDPVFETVFAQAAALLRTDGTITDVAGNPYVTMVAPQTDWIVSVKHRNHLGVKSDVAVDFSSGSGSFDFIDGWGAAPTKMIALGGNKFALHGGDANENQKVNYLGAANDRTAILTFLGGAGIVKNGYYSYDVNFDGAVKYIGAANDRTSVLTVLGSAGNAVTGDLNP